MNEIKRLPRWDYRHELINFQKHEDGSVSYQTRDSGKILYGRGRPFESSKLLALSGVPKIKPKNNYSRMI